MAECGDVVASVAYVSNWYQIFTAQGYTDEYVFAPLRHMWSLAVEEQFYLLWPVVMIWLMRNGRRRRLFDTSRWLVLIAVALTVLTALIFVPGRTRSPATTPGHFWSVFGHPVSRETFAYTSTITRSVGLLLGAAFAMIWRPVAVMRGPLRRKPWLVDVWAVGGLAALTVFCLRLPLKTPDGPAPLLFRGGLFAVGLATLFVLDTHPVMVAKLSSAAAAWIGVRSYGLLVPLADLPDRP